MLEKVTLMDKDGKENYIKEMKVKIAKCIEEAKTSEDPLKPWLYYVSWARQIYTHEVSKLLEIIVKACSEFQLDKRYKDDKRYLELWLEYALYTKKTMGIFEFLATHGIGIDNPRFYIAKSGILEDGEFYRDADKALQDGINRITNLEDRNLLKMNYKQLCARNEQRKKHQEDSDEYEAVDYNYKRSALSTIGRNSENIGITNNKSNSNTSNKKSEFAIFEDKNFETETMYNFDSKSTWVGEELQEKENIKAPKQWTGNKIKQKMPIQSTQPDFEIFVDQNFQEIGYKPSSQTQTIQLQEKKGSAKNVQDDDEEDDEDDENTDSRSVLQNRNKKTTLSNKPSFKPTSTTSTTSSSKSSSSSSSSSRSKPSSSSSNGKTLRGHNEELLKDGVYSFEEIRMKYKRETIFRRRRVEAERSLEQKERERQNLMLLELEKEKMKKEMEMKRQEEEILESQKRQENKKRAFGVQVDKKEKETIAPVVKKENTQKIDTRRMNETLPEVTATINFNNFELQTVYDDTIKIQTEIYDGCDLEEPTINTKNALKQLNLVLSAKVDGEDDQTRTLKNIPFSFKQDSTNKKTNGEIAQELGLKKSTPKIQYDEEEEEEDENDLIESSVSQYTGFGLSNNVNDGEEFEIYQDDTGTIPIQLNTVANESFEIFNDNENETERPSTISLMKSEFFEIANDRSDFGSFKSKNKMMPPMTPIIEQDEDESSSNKSSFFQTTQVNINRSSIVEKQQERKFPLANIPPPPSPSECSCLSVFKDEHQKEIFSKVYMQIKTKEEVSSFNENSPTIDDEIDFGNSIFNITRKLSEDGSRATYLVEDVSNVTSLDVENLITYYLKVDNPPCLWEYYIYSKMVERFRNEKYQRYFLKYHSVYSFNDKCFILMDYDRGTLDNVIEVYQKASKQMEEILVAFYSIEMIKAIEALHSFGIIHANLDLQSFMLRSTSSVEKSSWDADIEDTNSFWFKTGVQLMNFQNSIDCNLYPSNTIFQGSLPSQSNFKQIYPNWTFHTDFYGLASNIFTLLFQQKMNVIFDEHSNSFSPEFNFHPSYQVDMWKFVFKQLLNFKSCSVSQFSTHSVPYLVNVRKVLESYLSCKSISSRLYESFTKQNLLLHDYF